MKQWLTSIILCVLAVNINASTADDGGSGKDNSLLKLLEIGSPEKIVDPNSPHSYNASNRKAPAIAFDGTNYFVVWADYRLSSEYAGRLNNYDHLYRCDLYGARVDVNGQILDPSGIIIAEDVGFQEFPDVKFDGTNFLVVWSDWRVLGNFGDIYACRISKDGEILDPGGILVDESVLADNAVDLVYGDGIYLAVWEAYYYGNDYFIKAARIDTSGNVLDAEPIIVSVHQQSLLNPQVAFDGTNFLIVWSDQRSGNYDIKAARVNKDGTLLDPTAIEITNSPNPETQPSVAYSGEHFFVSWMRRVAFDNNFIEGILLNTDGTKSANALATIYHGEDLCYFPKIATANETFFVIWDLYLYDQAIDNIVGKRINGSGSVIDASPIEIANDSLIQNNAQVICDGENFVVVYNENTHATFSENIFIQKVKPSGAIIGEAISVPVGQSTQVNIASDSDGENHFLVWLDNRNKENWDIYGAVIDKDGNVVSNNPVPIPSPDNFKLKLECKFNGTNYLVAWTSHFGVYAIRVNKDGLVLDQKVLELATETAGNYKLSIASDGEDWLVVYRENRVVNYQNDNNIKACRIKANGEILDQDGFFITDVENLQHSPKADYDGANYIVVWEDENQSENFNSDIKFARVSSEGVVLDQPGRPVLTNPLVSFNNLQLAKNNDQMFLIWTELVDGVYSINGKFKNQQSEDFEDQALEIYSSTNFINFPDIIFDGKNYIIVWQEQIDGFAYDIKGCLVDVNGNVLENFTVTEAERNQLNPKLSVVASAEKSATSAMPDNTLISYIGFIEDDQAKTYNNYRVFCKSNQFLPMVLLPEAPELVYPQNNDTVAIGGFEFHWNPAENAENYTLIASLDSLFSEIVFYRYNYADTFATLWLTGDMQRNVKYYWKVAANNYVGQGAWSEVWSYYESIPLNTNEYFTGNLFNLESTYPNPANKKCTLSFNLKEEGILRYTIINSVGSKMLQTNGKHYNSGNHVITIDLSRFESGMYFLNFIYTGSNNKIVSKKVKVLKK